MWGVLSRPGACGYALAQAVLMRQTAVLVVSVAHESELEPTHSAAFESGHASECVNLDTADACLLCTVYSELGLTGNSVANYAVSPNATRRTSKQPQTTHIAAGRVQSARAPHSSSATRSVS